MALELFNPSTSEALTRPTCSARYAPVFWEPVIGTGERIVALVAIEPHESTAEVVSCGTYVVIPAARLRSMLGRQRASAAAGVLREAADFMTARQRAGLPISNLRPPFRGFEVGPAFIARASTTEQLLDAAVRNVTAFGTADEIIEDSDSDAAPRHTVRTSTFIGSLRRLMSGVDEAARERFDVKLRLPGDAPEVTVDYAFRQWLVQVTSLPLSARQSVNLQREAQSKLCELELARRSMDGNDVRPVLLVNEDALALAQEGEQSHDLALAMKDRLMQLSRSFDAMLLEAGTVEQGAAQISELGARDGTRTPSVAATDARP